MSFADRWSRKWKAETNAGYNSDKPVSGGSLVQDNYYGSGQTHLVQDNKNSSSNQNGNAGATLTYTPDAYHALRISPSFNMQRSVQSASTTYLTIQRDSGLVKTSQGYTANQGNGSSYSDGSQVYYEQLSPHSKRRFSVELNGQYGNNRLDNDDHVFTMVELANQTSNSLQHYLAQNSSPNWELGANFNYFGPLRKIGFMEVGYSWHQSGSQTTRNIYNQDSLNPTPILIDSLSQDYLYHSEYQQLHLGIIGQLHSLNFSVGLNVQPGKLSGTTSTKDGTIQYSYVNWVPSLQFNYSFSKSRFITIEYSGHPQIPGLQQLEPLTDLTNPQYPVIGNPALRPAFGQNVDLHYEQSTLQAIKFRGFGVNVGYKWTKDAILPNIIHPKDNSAIIQRTEYLNAGDVYSLYSSYHVTLPTFLHKRLYITLNGNLNSGHIIAVTDNVSYPTASTTASQSVHLQLLFPDIFESDLFGDYTFTNSRYFSINTPATSATSGGWGMSNRHYFLRQWILAYQISQLLTSAPGHGLQGNPASLTASFQHQFLQKNKATLSVTGYNLLNGANAFTQSVTPTSVTLVQTKLTGRYIIVSFLLKVRKFKE
jgi:Outer membrane protein beta-barrel family